jgi:hypothetical protein
MNINIYVLKEIRSYLDLHDPARDDLTFKKEVKNMPGRKSDWNYPRYGK